MLAGADFQASWQCHEERRIRQGRLIVPSFDERSAQPFSRRRKETQIPSIAGQPELLTRSELRPVALFDRDCFAIAQLAVQVTSATEIFCEIDLSRQRIFFL